MKKRIIYILTIFIVMILCMLLIWFIRIKTAKIEVTLVDNLKVEFNSDKKVSDFIVSINGKISDDYKIDTSKVGQEEITFKFVNDDNIKVKYTFLVEVVDTISPLIWLGNSYTVKKDSDIDLTKKILCGDNYDNNPKCYIEGDYNLKEAGSYKLVFKAVDSSGNETEKPFTLKVYDSEENKDTNKSTVEKKEEVYTSFKEVVNEYKNENNKIGIDISSWQGDIDFEKIKQEGVEFVIIRVGGGTDGDYFIDKKFKENIEKANEYDIDVGIYFYSNTNSVEDAIKDAKWVLKQIKGYKVTLPVVFDWEDWSTFNDYNLSFFGLTNVAEAFLNTIEEAGYKGMLYSSKSYLEAIWFPTKYDIWLAHYTSKTNYSGNYKLWQMCDDGKIDGIDANVDIDIMMNN